jgi:hypothetical protein
VVGICPTTVHSKGVTRLKDRQLAEDMDLRSSSKTASIVRAIQHAFRSSAIKVRIGDKLLGYFTSSSMLASASESSRSCLSHKIVYSPPPHFTGRLPLRCLLCGPPSKASYLPHSHELNVKEAVGAIGQTCFLAPIQITVLNRCYTLLPACIRQAVRLCVMY